MVRKSVVLIVSIAIAAAIATGVLWIINTRVELEVPGQVAISMACFALAKDLLIEVVTRQLALWLDPRALRQCLTSFLANMESASQTTIPWAELFELMDRLVDCRWRHRELARAARQELTPYAHHPTYARMPR